jgi:hypothetical protein
MSDPAPRTAALRRYAPFIGIVAILAIVGIVFALTRTDDFEDSSGDAVDAALTFDEAVEEGIDTSDWKNCDQETGRVAIPYPLTPPCVQPRQNDDEVSSDVRGVTDDEITVAVYISDPAANPLFTSVLGELEIDTVPADTETTIDGYLRLFEEHLETYGRSLDVHLYVGTSSGEDAEAARADAIRIATEIEPFAVIGGPLQAPAFSAELAARKILCIQACATAPQREFALENMPYVWPAGPLPEQAQFHASEFVGKQLAGRNAEFAGDGSLHDEERVFGYIAYNTTDGYYTPMITEFVDRLADEYDTEIALRREFLLDLARAQQDAEGFIAALKDAGVTTVLFSGDPIMPQFLTRAASAQDYFPEWVITGTVYVDTTVLARGFEPQQWRNAFGISLPTVRAERSLQSSYALYEWQYCAPPPSNVYATHIQGPQILLTGIHMAGPDLTPETFAAGWFKYPPVGGLPLTPLLSRGEHDIWPGIDVGGWDDAAVIYWDPDAEGPDETGQDGVGMYRYVNDGRRYKPLEWPSEPLPLFDDARSPALLSERGGVDLLPAYDSPCGGPAVSSSSGKDGDG